MDLFVRHAFLQPASDVCKALYRDSISTLVPEQVEDISETLLCLSVVYVVHEGLVELIEVDHNVVFQVIVCSYRTDLGLTD